MSSSDEPDYLTISPPVSIHRVTNKPPKVIYVLLVIIRFIAAWTYLLVTIWLVWAVVPTVLFNRLLRKLGVPNYWLPIDCATRWFDQGLLFLAGIRGKSEGTAKEPTVLVSNHLSALDSFAIYGYSPISMRFIMKQTMMFYCPPLFILAWVVGCITINRKAREEAIVALKRAAVKIKHSDRSFVIFAEGTRSRSGCLQPFKKGAFHVAKDAEVSITPVLISGAFDLWPPGSLFPLPGTIKIKVLEPIDTSSASVDELLLITRKRIVQAIQKDHFNPHMSNHYLATAPAIAWLSFLFGFVYFLW